MPTGMTFEAGKTYECAVQLETLNGYTFPENRANLSGKVNGKAGVISSVYYTNKAYVTVQFTVPEAGVTPAFTKQPVGGEVEAGKKLTVTWETNFTPVKVVIVEGTVKLNLTYASWNGAVYTYDIAPSTMKRQVYAYYGEGENDYVSSDIFYVSEKAAVSVLYGDVNGDGFVNNIDAMLVLQFAVGLIDETKIDVSAADVNGDGNANNIDAMLILQFAVGLIDIFPAEK